MYCRTLRVNGVFSYIIALSNLFGQKITGNSSALRGVVAQSKITLEKQLEIAFTELFDVSGEEEITMQLTDIAELVKMHNKKSYVRDVLQNKMGFLPSELPTTKYFPRIVEKRTSSGDISTECEYVKFKGRYYTFLKQNFKEA